MCDYTRGDGDFNWSDYMRDNSDIPKILTFEPYTLPDDCRCSEHQIYSCGKSPDCDNISCECSEGDFRDEHGNCPECAYKHAHLADY